MQKKTELIHQSNALPGRDEPLLIEENHFVNQTSLTEPLPINMEEVYLGLGCFWGAERVFWQLEGVYSTSVGYAGGYTPNPTYREVCSGQTGHTEAVRVIFDPTVISFNEILIHFWERHNPTQGMRQGNDIGTQYRSAIYTTTAEQLELAQNSMLAYQNELSKKQGKEIKITTEIIPFSNYYLAETYHQQYLAKKPNGYCGLGGTGVCYPEQK